jgi:hypothetical protein
MSDAASLQRQSMKRILPFLFIIVVGCNFHSIVRSQDIQSAVRNKVDEAHYKFGPNFNQTEINGIQANIREFIWGHWVANKSGRLTLESYTKEGERNVTIFDIRTSDPRVRSVDVVVQREFVDRNHKSKTFGQHLKDTREYSVAEIVRIMSKKNPSAKGQVIPPTESVQPNLYILRLRSKTGEILNDI